MSIDPSVFKEMDSLQKQFQALLKQLHPTQITPPDEGRFFHIASSIAYTAMSDYQRLREAYDRNDQAVAAWSCRNLLELAVFAKFVIQSKSNADAFAEDRLLDGLELAERLRELEILTNPALSKSALDAAVAEFKSAIQNEGINRKSYNRMSQLVKIIDAAEPDPMERLGSEYDVLNKVSSKMVHPTAWAILSADQGPERFAEACEILYIHGAKNLAIVAAQFMPHIRSHGLKHKP